MYLRWSGYPHPEILDISFPPPAGTAWLCMQSFHLSEESIWPAAVIGGRDLSYLGMSESAC